MRVLDNEKNIFMRRKKRKEMYVICLEIFVATTFAHLIDTSMRRENSRKVNEKIEYSSLGLGRFLWGKQIFWVISERRI